MHDDILSCITVAIIISPVMKSTKQMLQEKGRQDTHMYTLKVTQSHVFFSHQKLSLCCNVEVYVHAPDCQKRILSARFYVLNARKSGMSKYEVMVRLEIRGRCT